jgi:anthranilate phosphoribosyltransferase
MERNDRVAGNNRDCSVPRAARGGARTNALRGLLTKLMRGEDLTAEEAPDLLDALLDSETTDSQIAAALVALRFKGETVEELAGMAAAMRSRATRIRSRHACFIDTAGTGSSASKTFNVSTAAAFVIAGAGLPVAKHGSRAATSRSGSADVLTALGVNVAATSECSRQCLDEIGICFMFSPLYHGATARVAAVRRELGVPTTFNLLGPLSNPAAAPRQLVGVWHRDLVGPMARALATLGVERAWVVHGADGLDEVTLETRTYVAEALSGRVRTFKIEPEDFGIRRSTITHLSGGSAAENAATVAAVLNGSRRDEARKLVLLNAAAALFIGGVGSGLPDARRLAEQSLESGAAMRKLEELVKRTNVKTTKR